MKYLKSYMDMMSIVTVMAGGGKKKCSTGPCTDIKPTVLIQTFADQLHL